MDPTVVFLVFVAAASFVALGVQLELEERDEVRRDRECAIWLEAHGRRLRARVRALCEPRVRARQP